MQEMDPERVQARKAHRLRRRQYHSPGPNSVWHADGYDKLKLYSLPIYGCIDGFSRKVIWLYVTRSNNYPDNIAAYYLDSVKNLVAVHVNSTLILEQRMERWRVFTAFL